MRSDSGVVTTWEIDQQASAVTFDVEERLAFVMRRPVVGRFGGIAGTIAFDEARPDRSSVEITVDAATVDSGDARRDQKLRAGAFFDTARWPAIAFKSLRIDVVDGNAGRYRVAGELNVRGVARDVEFDVEGQFDRSPARIAATAVLDRCDFGMTWGNALFWIGDEVRISIDLKAIPIQLARAA
jgi:polyisoprenoid-binding protein YceI